MNNKQIEELFRVRTSSKGNPCIEIRYASPKLHKFIRRTVNNQITDTLDYKFCKGAQVFFFRRCSCRTRMDIIRILYKKYN